MVLGLAVVSLLSGRQVGAQDAAPRVELIERVLAVVDERPLLLSDVRALASGAWPRAGRGSRRRRSTSG